MRRRMRRHLALAAPGAAAAAESLRKPEELSWLDYLVMLLHIGAEIEQGLMVEYLYAAYSLGGDQVPEDRRKAVQRWRDAILTVAREEMGHLLSVQNVLCLLGAAPNLDREDYPWDTGVYPFPFTLEPLTADSLSLYVFAEMPEEQVFKRPHLPERYRRFLRDDLPHIQEVVARRSAGQGGGHRVGALYEEIVTLLGDDRRIPDSAFHAETLPFQATFAEWGREYRPPARRLDAGGSPESGPAPAEPHAWPAHVIVDPMATRTEAVAAVREIAAQGEAPHLRRRETGEPSHFDRFLEIYQELGPQPGWSPARAVPVNPTADAIENPQARSWAHLFNVRYRMLLSYLAHTFRLARVTPPDQPSVRAATMHRVFGEMYNLKTIAGILVRLPFHRAAGGHGPQWAGPPFEMPYSVVLPPGEADAWRVHLELLEAAEHLRRRLLDEADAEKRDYLRTLGDLDRQSSAWIGEVLAGARGAEVKPWP
jgi:rubrerythrin